MQDSWGGEDHFQLDGIYRESLLNKEVKRLNAAKAREVGPENNRFIMEYDLDLLLHDFIVLWQDEKEYKKAVKAGFAAILVTTDGFHVTTWKIPKSYMEMTDEDLFKLLAKEIEREKESFFKEDEYMKHTVKIYRSLADFNIGEPIKLENIIG